MLIVKKSPLKTQPFVIQNLYTGGRLGNYLFSLSELIIVHDAFINEFDCNAEMYTSWLGLNVNDVESVSQNIFNYPYGLSIFNHIKFSRFDYSKLFCKKDWIKKGAFALFLNIGNYKNKYGHVNLFVSKCGKDKALLFCLSDLLYNYNYFDLSNVTFEKDPDSLIDVIKYLWYDKTCVKYVVINPIIKQKKSLKLLFNYSYIKPKKDLLIKNLFLSYKKYINKLNKIDFFSNGDQINVCMHLRASDFSVGMNYIYPILYYTYYLDCLKDIKSKNQKKKIKAVFTFQLDDINIALFYRRKILENIHDIEVILETDNVFNSFNLHKDMNHIYFMSKFDYLIMSNSTYPFWSAFLSESYVYYPQIYSFPINYKKSYKNFEIYDDYIKSSYFIEEDVLHIKKHITEHFLTHRTLGLSKYGASNTKNNFFNESIMNHKITSPYCYINFIDNSTCAVEYDNRYKLICFDKILSHTYYFIDADDFKFLGDYLTLFHIYRDINLIRKLSFKIILSDVLANDSIAWFINRISNLNMTEEEKVIEMHKDFIYLKKKFSKKIKNPFDEVEEYFTTINTKPKFLPKNHRC